MQTAFISPELLGCPCCSWWSPLCQTLGDEATAPSGLLFTGGSAVSQLPSQVGEGTSFQAAAPATLRFSAPRAPVAGLPHLLVLMGVDCISLVTRDQAVVPKRSFSESLPRSAVSASPGNLLEV